MKKSIFILIVLVFGSCSKEEITEPEFDNESQYFEPTLRQITQIEEEKVKELGFNTNDIKLLELEGQEESFYLIEGDILIEESQLNELYRKKESNVTAHYHSNSLVSTPNTGRRIINLNIRGPRLLNLGFIRIPLYTPFTIIDQDINSLQQAINEFNSLNLNIEFRINEFEYDEDLPNNNGIHIYKALDFVVNSTTFTVPQRSAAALLPSGGNPGRFMVLHPLMTTENSSTQRKHIFMHELGHAIGMRHTDWQNHESCSNSSGESSSGGTNYIPGTPTGYDPTSIMLACGFNANGNLNNNDKNAFRAIY